MAAVPLLEVGFRISPHVLPSCISGFFLLPSVLYLPSLSCHVGMLWSEICAISMLATLQKFCRVFPLALKLWPLNLHMVWLPIMTNQSALLLLFFFFLQSDTSEVSTFFSYGESGIDGDRQSRGGAHHFSLSYLASRIKCFLIATNYHHTRV